MSGKTADEIVRILSELPETEIAALIERLGARFVTEDMLARVQAHRAEAGAIEPRLPEVMTACAPPGRRRD